jgi:hypothetical protein
MATADVALSSGRRIRKGERVAMKHNVVDRDQTVFAADAEQFNPYRESNSEVKAYGLAFGAGSKACIARALVTASSGPADADLDRIMVRILRSLYLHGLVADRSKQPVRALSAEERYDQFPVLFHEL